MPVNLLEIVCEVAVLLQEDRAQRLLVAANLQDVYKRQDEEYLGPALQSEGLIDGTQSEFGLYITTVDGYTADESAQEWWCLTKGGQSVNTGVDSTPIADGDAFELTLTTGW